VLNIVNDLAVRVVSGFQKRSSSTKARSHQQVHVRLVREVMEKWRNHCNTKRLHSSLGNFELAEFPMKIAAPALERSCGLQAVDQH